MRRRFLIIASTVLVVGIIAFLIYNSLVFRLVSTDPRNGSNGTFAQIITLNFNMPLNQSNANNFAISPIVGGKTVVQGNSLIFTPDNVLNINQVYTVTLTDPTSQSGQKLGTIKFSFTAKFVGEASLPKAQLQQLQSHTDAINKTDPLTNYVPYSSLDFDIEYKIDPASQHVTYYITLNAILLNPNDPNQVQTYRQNLSAYKTEALNFIRSKGIDPASLTIVYSPSDAQNVPEQSSTPTSPTQATSE